MNSKRKRQELADSLSSALEPPRRRQQSDKLNELLQDYSDPRDFESAAHPEASAGLASGRLTDAVSLPKPARLTVTARPADTVSLPVAARPTDATPKASSAVSLTDATSLTANDQAATSQSLLETARLSAANRPGFSLLNSLPDVSGYHLEFNQVTDYLLPQLAENEQAVYGQLYRLTWGFQRARAIIGIPKLAGRAHVGESTTRRIVKALEKKGLIKMVRLVFGLNHEQGYEFEVYPPPALLKHLESQGSRRKRVSDAVSLADTASPANAATMKDNVFVSKTTPTQTPASVGAASRFSLEECRRYADHLKATGQGITNPGGYATKIFRSGEADALVDAFLNPPVQLDASQCPDCQGRGWAYIDDANRDLGVKPCKHPRLR
jgi:hypothetical protein